MNRKTFCSKLYDPPRPNEKAFHNRSQSAISQSAAPRPIKRKTVPPPQRNQSKPTLKSCLKKSNEFCSSSNFQNNVEKFRTLSSKTKLESKISTSLAVSNKLKETDNIIEQLCSLESPLNNCPQKLLSYLEEIKNDLRENCNQMIKNQVSKINTFQDYEDKPKPASPLKIIHHSSDLAKILQSLCDEQVIKTFLQERGNEINTFQDYEDKPKPASPLKIIHHSSDLVKIVQSLCDEQVIKTFLQERGNEYSDPCNRDYESQFQTVSSNPPSLIDNSSVNDLKLSLDVSRVTPPMAKVRENKCDMKNETDNDINAFNHEKEITLHSYEIPHEETSFSDNQTDTLLPNDKIKVLEYFIAKEIEKCGSKDSIKPVILEKVEKSMDNEVKKSESQSSTDTLTFQFSVSTLPKDVETKASNSMLSFGSKNENYNKNVNVQKWINQESHPASYMRTDVTSPLNDQHPKNNLKNAETYGREKINFINNKASLPVILDSNDVSAYNVKQHDSSSTFIENVKLDYKLKSFPKVYPVFVAPVSGNVKKYSFNDNVPPNLYPTTKDTLCENSRHLEDEIDKLKFLVAQEMIRNKYPYGSMTKFDHNSGSVFENIAKPNNCQIKYFKQEVPEHMLPTSSDVSLSLTRNSSLTPPLSNNFLLENLDETKSWTSTKSGLSDVLKNDVTNQVKKSSTTLSLLNKFIKDLDSKEVKNVERLLEKIERKENELKTRCKFAKNVYQNFLRNKMKVVKSISEIKSSKLYVQNKKLIEHLNLMDLDLLESTMCMILDSKKLSEMAEDCKEIILSNQAAKSPVPFKKSRKRSSNSLHSGKHYLTVLDSNNSSKLADGTSKNSIPLSVSRSCQEFGESSAVVPDNFELVACNEYPSKIAGITVLKNVLYVALEDRRELYYSPLNDFRGNKLYWSRKYTSLIDPLDMISNGEFLFILLANGRMLKIDPNRKGSIETIMRLPLGLADDAISLSQLRSGNILVINRSPGQLIELDANSKVVKVINLADKLDDISHVLQLSSQKFVVSCSGYANRGVCLVDSRGEIISKSSVDLNQFRNIESFNSSLSLTNILKCPLHLAADTNGLIYVADSSKNCIITLTANLECVSKVYFSKFPFSQPTRLYYHPKSRTVHFSCLSKSKWVVGSFKTTLDT